MASIYLEAERGNRPPNLALQLLTPGLNFVAPLTQYYGMRAAGVGIYPALIVGAVAPALRAVWMLLSVRSRRPLTYLFARPLLGRLLSAGESSDRLWERLRRFRRIWRVATVIWGVAVRGELDATEPRSDPTRTKTALRYPSAPLAH
ncbi:MAG TPA: hypothetical protein VGP33_08895 [Chloroflexota bacterium]|nr:hypothetical protein [Chloroflexota bacterium]